MIYELIKFYVIGLVIFYINKHWLIKYIENNDLKSYQLNKKADTKLVLIELEKKQNKEPSLQLNDKKVAIDNKNIIIGNSAEEIKIGSNNHFINQFIDIGLLSINKYGLNVEKTPTINFKGSDVYISFRDDKLVIKDNKYSEEISISDVYNKLLLVNDKTKSNKSDIDDISKSLITQYYNKSDIDNIYNTIYTKHDNDAKFITKEQAKEIIVNNEGYSKMDSNLIFVMKKDLFSKYYTKDEINNINLNILGTDLNLIGDQNKKNHLLIELISINTVQLINHFESTSFVGITSWNSSNELSCIKPQYSFVWSTNEFGDIHKGDLIVSSGVHFGYACRQTSNVVSSKSIGKCILEPIWEENNLYCLIFCIIF